MVRNYFLQDGYVHTRIQCIAYMYIYTYVCLVYVLYVYTIMDQRRWCETTFFRTGMYIYVYVYTYAHIYVYIHTYIYVCTCETTFFRTVKKKCPVNNFVLYTYIHGGAKLLSSGRVCIYVHVNMHRVCIYVHVYVYMYIYTIQCMYM